MMLFFQRASGSFFLPGLILPVVPKCFLSDEATELTSIDVLLNISRLFSAEFVGKNFMFIFFICVKAFKRPNSDPQLLECVSEDQYMISIVEDRL